MINNLKILLLIGFTTIALNVSAQAIHDSCFMFVGDVWVIDLPNQDLIEEGETNPEAYMDLSRYQTYFVSVTECKARPDTTEVYQYGCLVEIMYPKHEEIKTLFLYPTDLYVLGGRKVTSLFDKIEYYFPDFDKDK